jgi:two-component system, OmpR family, phosphate regulon sensor histidine kinase PhoR
MTPRRVHARTVLLVVCLASVLATAFIIDLSISRIAQSGPVQNIDSLFARIRVTILLETLVIAGIAGALALAAGGWLEARLLRVRAEVLRVLREGKRRGIVSSHIAELDSLVGAVHVFADELRQHSDAMTRERNEMSFLVASVGEGIVQLDEEGRIIRLNIAARQLLKLPQASEGQPVAALVRNAELRLLFEHISRGYNVPPGEVTLEDGRRLLVIGRTVDLQVIDPDATVERNAAVVSIVDLTELRKLETVRRDFVANVSHELKTPLTSIRGYAETLLADDDLPAEDRRRFIAVIAENSTRLQRIIDDLLDLARVESGRWTPNLGPIDVASIATDVWTGLQGAAARKRVTMSMHGNGARSIADPDALRQIFVNLFDNALRYTGEGGFITVTVQSPSPEWVEVGVRDNGAGIPSDALPRVFERFYRVDPARSRAEGGTGLGLAIVKHLLESMGGEVSAESELGKGTLIRFRLPAPRNP